jgi:pyridoxamine 5'-phosphate oxidase
MVSWNKDLGGTEEVNAVTVATIGLDGFPKSSCVVKSLQKKDLFFYTNYNSRSKALKRTLKYLSFFWHSMERQVIIKGLPKNLRNHFW